MKIQILSDLHLEFLGIDIDSDGVDSDVVVLAGDIHPGSDGIEWAARTWQGKPVIYVPGNHEYYGQVYQELRRSMREVAAQHDNIRLLDQDACVIDGVLFVGCTLWTDFRYFQPESQRRRMEAMYTARRCMNDFRLIRFVGERGNHTKFRPEHSASICEQELAYIQFLLHMDSASLAARFGVDQVRARVVVTHHLPCTQSAQPRFRSDILMPCFASRFENTVSLADLWIHGHTHHSFDYRLEASDGKAATRVVCNPRGYCNVQNEPENRSFNQNLMISVTDHLNRDEG